MVIGILIGLSFWVPFVLLWYLGYFFYGLFLGVFMMLIVFLSLYKLYNTPRHVEGTVKKANTFDLADKFKGGKDEKTTG